MSIPSDRFSFEEPEAAGTRKRRAVMLQALFFTPLAMLFAAGVVFASAKISSGETGYVVMLTVTGVLLLVIGYQAVHYIRDLRAEPMLSEGEVTKKWSKGNLFFLFMPSYYIAVQGKIYTITRDQYRGLLEEDMVRIRHYPYTLTVEHVERFDEVEKKFVPADPDAIPY